MSAAACDRDGRLAGASPVLTLFGWNPEELQSVRTLDLVHPADWAPAEAVLQAVVLYKIVEAARTNVMRHASARSVPVSLSQTGQTLAADRSGGRS